MLKKMKYLRVAHGAPMRGRVVIKAIVIMKGWYQKRCCLTKTTNKKATGQPKKGCQAALLEVRKKKICERHIQNQ